MSLRLLSASPGGGGDVTIAAIRRTAALVLPNVTQLRLTFDAVDEEVGLDVDLTGEVALSGTVTKVSGQNTLAGVGTAFSTELKAGQDIVVGAETKMIASIASATSLTVASNWGASQAGVAASRKNNDRITVIDPGVYDLTIENYWPAGTTNFTQVIPYLNGVTTFSAAVFAVSNTAGRGTILRTRRLRLAAGDYLSVDLYNGTGGSITLAASPNQRLDVVRLGS